MFTTYWMVSNSHLLQVPPVFPSLLLQSLLQFSADQTAMTIMNTQLIKGRILLQKTVNSSMCSESYSLTQCDIIVYFLSWMCCLLSSTADKWFLTKSIHYTHTHLMALCPGLPGWAGTKKVKPIWILLKQETVSGSGISWVICKSAPRSRQITTPAPHHSVFTGRMPFLPPKQQHQSTEGIINQYTKA